MKLFIINSIVTVFIFLSLNTFASNNDEDIIKNLNKSAFEQCIFNEIKSADKSKTLRQLEKLCEDQVRSLLTKETGQPLIKKLLFTQWLDN